MANIQVESFEYERARDPGRTHWLQWRAIFAGAVAGFAATLILGTLGMALGFSAADHVHGDTGTALGSIWTVLTVIVAGLCAGMVTERTWTGPQTFDWKLTGLLTWAAGVLILFGLLALGGGSSLGALGLHVANRTDRATTETVDRDRATDVASGVAWGLFASQILGLVATMVGARASSTNRTHRSATVPPTVGMPHPG